VVRPGENRAPALKVRFWRNQSKEYPAEHYPDARSEHDVVKAPGLRFDLARLSGSEPLKELDKVYAIGNPRVAGARKRWGTILVCVGYTVASFNVPIICGMKQMGPPRPLE